MSLASTYVRARDGALYRNPVLIFPEGFVCFDDEEPPELVAWIDGDRELLLDVPALLASVLGRAFDAGAGLSPRGRSLRVVPLSEPWEFRPAASYFFELAGRIPRPQKHDGTERYPRRCSGLVIDMPAHAFDAAERFGTTLGADEVPKRD